MNRMSPLAPTDRNDPPPARAGDLWFSAFGGRYSGPEPDWYDRDDFAWVEELENNWEVMRDELLALVNRDAKRLGVYYNHAMVFPPKAWRTMGLLFWTWRVHDNIRACPRTIEVLSRLPDVTSASLSALGPGSNINPHQGDTNAVIRIHLPLIVPAGLPECGFQVGNEARPWVEGQAMLFLDAKTHFAWNRSQGTRYVMILDVFRPEFSDRKAYVCANVLASITMQGFYQRFPALNRANGTLRLTLHAAARTAIRVILPLQRRLIGRS
ncbi:hypothetical protein A8B78_11775 [Jannaschia sp. EhC01]|nr:hypothetical protein A8B78_11775 [Jannaschia sp. EhC01]